MAKTFLISDLHLQNENIIKYCNRPFTDANDQTEQLIANWNATVTSEDTTIVLGDFIMGAADNVGTLLYRLNGKIILVQGNHDTPKKLEIYAQHPEKIQVHQLYHFPYKNLYFICCHFPLVHPDFASMIARDNSEVVYCFGHVHEKTPHINLEDHSFNMSADVVNFTPVNIDSIYSIVKEDFIARGVWGRKYDTE